MNTVLSTAIPKYELKYDADTNKMRDLTWEELKKQYGKGSKVVCPCFNREYTINSAFIKHHETERHKNWLIKETNEYIQEIGHCGNNESKIETLLKQQREHKVMYHTLRATKEECDKKLESLTEKNIDLEREIEILKRQKKMESELLRDRLRESTVNREIVEIEIIEMETEVSKKSKFILDYQNINQVKTDKRRSKTKQLLSNFSFKL